MKALTICQPYAHLIAIGEKRVENRTWLTQYRGPLAIHAGKSREWLTDPSAYPDLVFGAVIAIGDLVDCLHIATIRLGNHDAKYPWLREHAHTHGDWCWILDNVREIDPIPCRGAQGLWNPDRRWAL